MCQRLGRRSRRLLLVEDHTDLREALAVALKTKGYALDCAGGGTQAMAMMARSDDPPDVVITRRGRLVAPSEHAR